MIPGGSIVPAQVHAAVGERVRRQPARLGRVRVEAPGGERAKSPTHAGGFGRFLGPGHSAHQHAVPEGPAHARVRQGSDRGVPSCPPDEVVGALLFDFDAPRRLALPDRLQAVSSITAEPVLVSLGVWMNWVRSASMSSRFGPRRFPRVLAKLSSTASPRRDRGTPAVTPTPSPRSRTPRVATDASPRDVTRATTQVDAPAPRRQALEPQQLPHGHDPSIRRCGRHPRAHALQRSVTQRDFLQFPNFNVASTASP
jgi:hypothetical protein